MSQPDAKNIIFNVGKTNRTDFDSSSQFISFRNQVFLNNMENYYVRVYEAKIPFSTIPLFKFRKDTYSITIGDIRVFVNDFEGTNNNVFYIQQFLDAINSAFKTAHELNGFESSPPYFYYDHDIDYLKLVVDASYIISYDPYIYVPIFVNEKLILKFSGFMNKIKGTADPLGKDNEIVYKPLADNYFENGISNIINYPCIVMTSQSKFVNDFIEYQGILISSRNIPVNQQYIFKTGSENSTFPVLAFVPIKLTADEYRYNYFYYTQDFPIWSDIIGSGKLQKIDIELYSVDQDYVIEQIPLLTNETFLVRLQFIDKSLVNNYLTY